MGACEDGFGDCANGATDGCETPTVADKVNCGGCGVTCTVGCAASQCVNVKQISAGYQYTCATATDGSVYCWGNNTEWGNLGLGFAGSFELSPKLLALPGPAVQVAANRGSARQHACAVLESGALYCWGANGNGQLGNGQSATELAPIEVPGISDVVQVSVGGAFTCAVTAGAELYCWGNNGSGQLGVAGGDLSSPTLVLSGVKEVTTGDMFTCVRTSSDALKCFGLDSSGQLGNGASGGGYLPQTVAALPGITHLGAGDAHACAANANGLSCWGEAGTFQLGNGGVTDQQLPIAVAVSGVERIALGAGHSGVIAGGDVWMWGAGSAGQIGDGAQANATQPVDISAVAGLPPIADLSLGNDHACAVDTAGKAYCWGGNYAGQIGNQTQNAALTPTAVVFP